MKIEVTQEDIQNGCRCEANACPIALAVRRTLQVSETDDVFVGPHSISIFNDRMGECVRISLPKEAFDFIIHFDATGQATPFSFELDYTP